MTREIVAQRTIITTTGDPTQRRIAELERDRLERRLADARQTDERIAALEAERAAEQEARAQRVRDELDQRLMAEYRVAVPGTTEAEAKQALPELRHRHRLAEIERREQEIADLVAKYAL